MKAIRQPKVIGETFKYILMRFNVNLHNVLAKLS